MKPNKAIARLGERLAPVAGTAPQVSSFMTFLTDHAMVKTPGGQYTHYTLHGREALTEIIATFDLVLGSQTGHPLTDATLAICGGAQFGKSILVLNFVAYATAVLYYNCGYYLPDDDLVEGIVDTKLRPDVIEQIAWLGPLMQVGKMEDKRGRSVNRKGAFQVSDGKRKAFGMIRGMGKIPTSFSMDIAIEDEKDDIPAKRSKYLTGRMSSSDLRLRISIGTQRLHSAGQQKEWEDGSQGVCVFAAGTDGRMVSIEDNWPGVCRMAVDGTPRASDPKLTLAADFRDDAGRSWGYEPGALYYFADPETGAVIDRTRPVWNHLRPERIKLRRWSWRTPQLIFDAMPVQQAVSRWQDAVKDPEMMTVFRCDVLGDPANTEQALSPEVLTRARTVEAPFDLSLAAPGSCPKFAGLDTGNRCWFVTREVQSEAVKRVRWAEQVPLSQMVARTSVLFQKMGLQCLAIDANPAVDEARALCYLLNGLGDVDWKAFNQRPDSAVLRLTKEVTWDGERKRWTGLRCFVVEFSLKQGAGIAHKLGRDPQGGYDRFYPVIQANRFEAIDRVVKEFLTPAENVIRVVAGQVLDEPVMRLPQRIVGSPPVIETLDAHLVTGSNRAAKADGEAGDYVDKCENHFLLGLAYSALAEMVGGYSEAAAPVEPETFTIPRPRKFL